MISKRKRNKILCIAGVMGIGLCLNACSAKEIAKDTINLGVQAVEGHFEEKNAQSDAQKDAEYQKIVEEKAPLYGIDPEGVVVSSGGSYYRVPIDTIHTYEDVEAQITTYRKWLRFMNTEMPEERYYVGFFERNDLDIMYGGFSNNDNGFDSEYYWDDNDIMQSYITTFIFNTDDDPNSADTNKKFYEYTGIDRDTAFEMDSRLSKTYPSFKETTPDKNAHTYTFIPGDTIMHMEKYVIGDENCPIESGTYTIDLPGCDGIIHVTDSEDNTLYRMDAHYRYGHSDELYNYEVLPATVELSEGDIIYITNAISTFDRIG